MSDERSSSITAAFEARPHNNARRPWLSGSWAWCVLTSDGRLLADGEGCSCAGVAIETARTVAREEFQIGV